MTDLSLEILKLGNKAVKKLRRVTARTVFLMFTV